MTYRDEQTAKVERLEAQRDELQLEVQRLADDKARLEAELDDARSSVRSNKWSYRRSRYAETAQGLFILLVGGAAVLGAIYGLVRLSAGCQGCDNTPRGAGFATRKIHHEEYTTVVCTSSRRGTTHCHTVHHPERWQLDVTYEDETRSFDVSKRYFKDVRLGHWYCVERPCADRTRDEGEEEST